MHDANVCVPFAGCVVGKKLGSGYWGTVYLVSNTRTGEEFACKFLPRGRQVIGGQLQVVVDRQAYKHKVYFS